MSGKLHSVSSSSSGVSFVHNEQVSSRWRLQRTSSWDVWPNSVLSLIYPLSWRSACGRRSAKRTNSTLTGRPNGREFVRRKAGDVSLFSLCVCFFVVFFFFNNFLFTIFCGLVAVLSRLADVEWVCVRARVQAWLHRLMHNGLDAWGRRDVATKPTRFIRVYYMLLLLTLLSLLSLLVLLTVNRFWK